jgi:glycosyltransferase involved in cell wall biosynthesis
MLLSNAFRPDPRVAREAEGLTGAGHRITIVCWDRLAELPQRELYRGIEIIRVQNVRSVYGSGWRQLFYLPKFWREAIHSAFTLCPDAVHCHDLDTLPAGWWLKKQLGARLVYDAHEDYPAMMSLYLPSSLVGALSWLERFLLRRVDYTITASTIFADKLCARGVGPVLPIGNYHDLEPFDAITTANVATTRATLGLADDDLIVAYIGGFSRNRELLPLIEAARHLPGVQVLLWGDGHQRMAVEAAAAQTPNVRYLGWLSADQVPVCMKVADAIYYCLKPDYPGSIYNAPNTLAQAMAASRPLIANDVGDLGRIVRETGCGMLVPDVTPDAIRQAIQMLRDPALRRRMGEAGREAAETRYNWNTAGRLLNRVYAELLEDPSS